MSDRQTRRYWTQNVFNILLPAALGDRATRVQNAHDIIYGRPSFGSNAIQSDYTKTRIVLRDPLNIEPIRVVLSIHNGTSSRPSDRTTGR